MIRPFRPFALATVLASLSFLAACGPGEPGDASSDAGSDDAPASDAVPALGPVDGRDLPPADTGRVAVGDTAPDFTLMSYRDGPVTLSDFRGSREVILVFYRGHW